jgi:hypothetical protein
MASSALWSVICRLNLCPYLGLKIKYKQVVESDSLVVDTTMATEQIDLAIEKSGTCVCSRTGLVLTVTFLVLWALDCEISLCTFPGVGWDLKEPSVIKTDLG